MSPAASLPMFLLKFLAIVLPVFTAATAFRAWNDGVHKAIRGSDQKKEVRMTGHWERSSRRSADIALPGCLGSQHWEHCVGGVQESLPAGMGFPDAQQGFSLALPQAAGSQVCHHTAMHW